jgi:predicted nucleic acid-binding Zn ribbon protein
MPRARSARSLGEALAQLIQDLGFEKKLKEQHLLTQWPQAVGEQIASHARAVNLEGGKLFVEVDSAAWRQELHYMKTQILERLNQMAGSDMVQDIILTNRKRR